MLGQRALRGVAPHTLSQDGQAALTARRLAAQRQKHARAQGMIEWRTHEVTVAAALEVTTCNFNCSSNACAYIWNK